MTHRERVLRRLGLPLDKHYSIDELSKKSGIPKSILMEVKKRGEGAYHTQPSSVRMKGTFKKGVNAPISQKLSQQQWSFARVYSFIDGNPLHDTDLRNKLR